MKEITIRSMEEAYDAPSNSRAGLLILRREFCSFCGRTNRECTALIVGHGASICEHCVAECVVAIAENNHQENERHKWRVAHEEGSAGE